MAVILMVDSSSYVAPTLWNTVKGILALAGLALAVGAAALIYIYQSIVHPSLNL